MYLKFYDCAVESELTCRMFSFLVFWNSLYISDAIHAGGWIHSWVFYVPFGKWQCHAVSYTVKLLLLLNLVR